VGSRGDAWYPSVICLREASMYGTAVAHGAFLTLEDQQYLHLAQCGLCAGLRRTYGLPFAALANCDARLLVLVAASQSQDEVRTSTTVCPVKAFSRRMPSLDNDVPIEFGAACAVLVWLEKLLDRERDHRNPLWRLGPVAARPAARAARRALTDLRFPVAEIERARASQVGVEDVQGLCLADYLQPSADIIGRFFAHSAVLGGRPESVTVLSLLGQAFGRIVALLDACEDLSSDRARGLFNPISWHFGLEGSKPLPCDVLAEVFSIALQELERIELALNRIDFHQLGGVLANILTRGVPAKLQRGLRKLWRANHWEADWPNRVLEGLDDETCPICGVPHLPARSTAAAEPAVTDTCRGVPLWCVCKSLSKPQSADAKDLGFAGREEQLLSALVPVIGSSGL
jgi:hypothetical protein